MIKEVLVKKKLKRFPFYIQKTTVMCISSKFNVENSLQRRTCNQFLSMPGMIRLINMILFFLKEGIKPQHSNECK